MRPRRPRHISRRNETGFAVNSCGAFWNQNNAGRRCESRHDKAADILGKETLMRHISTATLPAILQAIALLVGVLASSAAAQVSSAWGNALPQQEAWRPDLFADYLLTGQTPHPSVARIVAPDEGGVSLGSGVLVDINQSQGLVLTNWHVIRDTRSAVLVQFPDGFQSAGTVIRHDEAWDLAALVIWKPQAAPIPLAEQPPQIGELLTIAGFGRGAYRAETGPCTEYLAPGAGYAKEFVELSATARQGDSGGPILNADGKLAGVLFGQSEGRTIGSCSTRVRTFLASVGSSGFTPPPGELAAAAAMPPAAMMPVDIQKPPPRLAAAPLEEPLQRSVHVTGYGMPSPTSGLPTAPVGMMPFQASAETGDIAAAVVAYVTDFERNGQTLLAAAGGLALVIVGLRMIIASRAS
jgi:S1-C subfamily serine protease